MCQAHCAWSPGEYGNEALGLLTHELTDSLQRLLATHNLNVVSPGTLTSTCMTLQPLGACSPHCMLGDIGTERQLQWSVVPQDISVLTGSLSLDEKGTAEKVYTLFSHPHMRATGTGLVCVS